MLAGSVVFYMMLAELLSRPVGPRPTRLSEESVEHEASATAVDLAIQPRVLTSSGTSPAQTAEREHHEGRTTMESPPHGTRLIKGQIVKLPDKTPLEGVTVRLSDAFSDLATTTTDKGGRFQIPNPKKGARKLHFDLPNGWACEQNPRRLVVKEVRGQRHVSIEAFVDLHEPVVGRVVDEVSGLALEGFVVRVKSSDKNEVAVTNSDGRFETRAAFASGPLSWYGKSDANSPSRGTRIYQGIHCGKEVTCSVSVGPTYRLRITPAAALVDDLDARLLSRWLIVDSGGSSWQAQQASIFQETGEGISVTAVESTLRFPPGTARDLSRIVVSSSETGWIGIASVPSGDRVHEGLVELELDQHASTEIVVQSAILLEDPYLTIRAVNRSRSATGGRLDWILEPGAYEVGVSDPRHDRWTEIVTVRPGPNRITARLSPRPIGGTVAGEVRRRSGRCGPVPPMLAELESTESRRPAFGADIDWEGPVGRFLFHDIPEGHYRLSIDCSAALHWSQEAFEICPPESAVVFVWEDEVPTVRWRVQAVSATTGEKLRCEVLTRNGNESAPWFGRTRRPADSEFLYSVQVQGYESYWGDQTDFHDVPSERRPTRVATVALRRGWSERIVARGAEGEPIAGVNVIADGEVLGTTGNDGVVVVRRSKAPEQIEFEHTNRRTLRYRKLRGGCSSVTMTAP